MSNVKKTRHFHAGKLRKIIDEREFVEVAESNGKVFVSDDGCIYRNGKTYYGNDNGHKYMSTNIAGKSTYIHRIVYEIFVEQIPDGMEVDHINNVRNDNRVSNLRVVTHYDNLTKNPLSVAVRRAACQLSIKKAQEAQKIAVVMIDNDGTEHWFPCQRDAALATGTHFTSISQVIHGKLKRAGGKHWRLAKEIK